MYSVLHFPESFSHYTFDFVEGTPNHKMLIIKTAVKEVGRFNVSLEKKYRRGMENQMQKKHVLCVDLHFSVMRKELAFAFSNVYTKVFHSSAIFAKRSFVSVSKWSLFKRENFVTPENNTFENNAKIIR